MLLYIFFLQDVCEFLQSGGMVAVYDATNTNMERRELIHHVVSQRMGYKLFFIESICNDPAIIETNIMVITFLYIFVCAKVAMIYVVLCSWSWRS